MPRCASRLATPPVARPTDVRTRPGRACEARGVTEEEVQLELVQLQQLYEVPVARPPVETGVRVEAPVATSLRVGGDGGPFETPAGLARLGSRPPFSPLLDPSAPRSRVARPRRPVRKQTPAPPRGLSGLRRTWRGLETRHGRVPGPAHLSPPHLSVRLARHPDSPPHPAHGQRARDRENENARERASASVEPPRRHDLGRRGVGK